MPAPQMQYYNFAAGPVTPVTTAETVVGTTRGVSSPYPGCVFAIESSFDLLTPTGATSFIVRIRRDAVGGTLVLASPAIAAAASTQLPRVQISTTDTIPGEVTSQLYVVTVAVAGATANPSVANIFTKITVAE